MLYPSPVIHCWSLDKSMRTSLRKVDGNTIATWIYKVRLEAWLRSPPWQRFSGFYQPSATKNYLREDSLLLPSTVTRKASYFIMLIPPSGHYFVPSHFFRNFKLLFFDIPFISNIPSLKDPAHLHLNISKSLRLITDNSLNNVKLT